MVKNKLVVKCQCHGFSGSCQLKTCWKEMIKWEEVFSNLQMKYDSSICVKQDARNGTRLRNCDPIDKPYQHEDLVYLKESPNLCQADASVGSQGTHNRRCTPSSDVEDSCIVMCCGRGYRTQQSQKETLGKCRLHGFKLKCDIKMQTITEYFCK